MHFKLAQYFWAPIHTNQFCSRAKSERPVVDLDQPAGIILEILFIFKCLFVRVADWMKILTLNSFMSCAAGSGETGIDRKDHVTRCNYSRTRIGGHQGGG